MSRSSKVLTNDSKTTSDPDHVECLQQLLPPPSGGNDIPLQMSEDLSEHWSSEIAISVTDLWNTQDAFERILKFHSMPALTQYIRSRSLLCVPDIGDWRMKDLFQRIFLSSDPENEALKELVYNCLHMPWLTVFHD